MLLYLPRREAHHEAEFALKMSFQLSIGQSATYSAHKKLRAYFTTLNQGSETKIIALHIALIRISYDELLTLKTSLSI